MWRKGGREGEQAGRPHRPGRRSAHVGCLGVGARAGREGVQKGGEEAVGGEEEEGVAPEADVAAEVPHRGGGSQGPWPEAFGGREGPTTRGVRPIVLFFIFIVIYIVWIF